MSRPKIALVSLGGTITMTSGDRGGIAPTLVAADLLRAVPALDRIAELEPLSPLRLPGASLTIDHLLDLARLIDERLAGGVDGVVVVQGTDTIEETAFVLDLLVQSDKPIVVTGAMRGAEAPGADGPANLLAATITAASLRAARFGTLVVLNDEIHAARFVQKSHTALPSAFHSPLAGPLGLVVEGRSLFQVSLQKTRPLSVPAASKDAPVALIRMALGDDGRMLKALPALGYRGVVIEAMGAGHVPASVAPLIAELAALMPVVLSVRVHTGPTFERTYGFAGSEIDLITKGALASGTLTGLKARLLLSLLLRCDSDRQEIESTFRAYASCEAST